MLVERDVTAGFPDEPRGARRSTVAADPMRRMSADGEEAVATAMSDGKTYYFCSAGCRRSFEKEPAKYTKA